MFPSDLADKIRTQPDQVVPHAFPASPAPAVPVLTGQIVSAVDQGAVCKVPEAGDCNAGGLFHFNDFCAFFLAKGDPVCEGKWETYFTNLTVVLHNLQMGFNLPIVIGGYVGRHIEPYMDRVREAVWNRSCYQDESISLLAGRYGALASAVGGAMLLVEDFNRQV